MEGSTRQCQAIIAHRLDRLRYLRTPWGNAVINDMSRAETDPIASLDVGDFVNATIRPTESYYHWSKSNPYRVISFQKIAPPDDVDRIGRGNDVQLFCNVVLDRQNPQTGIYIYKSNFARSIYDIDRRIRNPMPSEQYKVSLKLRSLPHQPGKELVVSAFLDTIIPEVVASLPENIDLSRIALSTSLSSDESFDQTLRRYSEDLPSLDGYNSSDNALSVSNKEAKVATNNNAAPGQWAISYDTEDVATSTVTVKTREERARDLVARIWNNNQIRKVIHTHQPEIFELIAGNLTTLK